MDTSTKKPTRYANPNDTRRASVCLNDNGTVTVCYSLAGPEGYQNGRGLISFETLDFTSLNEAHAFALNWASTPPRVPSLCEADHEKGCPWTGFQPSRDPHTCKCK